MILEQALTLLPLIIGAYITFSLLKLPDFSIESSYLFGAVIAYVAKDSSIPLFFTAFLAGAFVGLVVATLNQLLKLPFLLGAIITNGLFHGLTQYFLGTSMASFHPQLALSDYSIFLGVSTFSLVIPGVLFYSEMGYCLAIYGNNPLFFKQHGIFGPYVLYFGLFLSHGLAGLGGFLFALSNGFIDLTMNYGMVLLCITSLILGKSLFKTDRQTLFVPLIGLTAYFLIQKILLKLGINLKFFNAFQALTILGALLFLRKEKKITLDQIGV